MGDAMSYQHITRVHSEVLEALARYKFLTTDMLLCLNIMTDRGNLNRELKRMREFKKPLIHTIGFGVHPKMGKLSSFHTLTLHGVEMLTNGMHYEEEDIKYLKGTASVFHRDYFHREAMIYFQMLLDDWCRVHGHQVVFFDTYFDPVGNSKKDKNLTSRTKISIEGNRSLYADGLFELYSLDGKPSYFAIEMYRGKDTGRVMQQLRSYVKALAHGSINDKYGWKKAVRVLLVFEHQANLEAVLNQVSKDRLFENMRELFLFKTYEEIFEVDKMGFWVGGNKEVSQLL